MTAISNLNIGSSSMDLDTLYQNLQTAEEASLTPITNEATSVQNKISAFGQLKSALQTLQTATAALAKSSNLNATGVISSNTAFSAKTDNSATVGNYQISVQQLAQAQTLLSGKISSHDQVLGSSSNGERTITISQGNGSPVAITLSDKDTTLDGIVSAINKSGANVIATSIKANDGEYYLSITAKDTGADSNINISVTGDDQLQALIGYQQDGTANGLSETQQGKNALLTVNGIAVESASNTVTGAPAGVTLALTSTTSSAETLSIGHKTDDSVSAIKSWVNSYNNLQGTIASLTKYSGSSTADQDSSSNGPLIGNGTVRDIQNQLRSLLTQSQSGTFSILAQLGITQDTTTASSGSKSNLSIDETKLAQALQDNPQAVVEFFNGDGKTTGFSTQMSARLDTILSDTAGNKGVLTTAIDSLNSSYEDLSDRYYKMQTTIDATMARYKTQFTQLNQLLVQMNQTKDYLTAQFDTSDD